MTVGLRGFISVNQTDHVLLPSGGVGARFVCDFVKNIRKIVQGIDHLFDIGILNLGDCRVRQSLGVVSACARSVAIIDTLNVVCFGEPVTVSGDTLELQAETIEKHNRYIDSGLSGIDDPLAQSVEEALIELGKIEFELTVGGVAGPGPQERQGEVALGAAGARFRSRGW